jgi:hypothetical protein
MPRAGPAGADPPPSARAAPLAIILALSFISSLGTGIVTTGIYFIAENAYGFTKGQNYALALANGIMYIAGAAAAGRLLRWLRGRGVSTRAALAAVLLLLAALCGIPLLAGAGGGAGVTEGAEGMAGTFGPAGASHAPIWLLVILYSPLTGILWPVIESYLSGGRSGTRLRSALGRFNITWASALVIGLILIGPSAKAHAPELIAALGIIHIASLALLIPLGREPGRHLDEHHDPHPLVYTQLLTTFRILLPASYLVLTALNPYLPRLLARLGYAADWRAPLAATWTAARVVTFLTLERWHGWHGRWAPAGVGVAGLIGGFALAVMSPALGRAGPATVLIGLFIFGVGMAVIYTAALYYALEVGKAEVDAGGTHEALIGLGYTIGPLCGLAGIAAGRAGAIPPTDSAFDTTVLAMVAAAAIAAAAFAGYRSWRVARGNGTGRRASN